MSKHLHIAQGLSLPLDAVTQTFSAIGRKGAGKTYLATLIAEQMLDAEAQVVALDPVGNWFGLRIGADGKSKGKDIFVIGGEHGDLPLTPEAGARVAQLLVEKRVSAVLDVSAFRMGERKRFAAAFGEELFHLKKSQRTAMHLFVEEAQLFAPQRPGPDEARMLGAFESIIRLGRNYGIGATLVTQRPQSVNKEVLSQVECLCVLQVNGTHERKALEEWVQEAGADRKLIGELPSLSRGEGYVWSPSWLRIFKRVHFHQKTTFDASATPEVGKAAKAAKLSTVDVEALRADLAEVVEAAERSDPRVLVRRIAQLEQEKQKGAWVKAAAPAPASSTAKADPRLGALVRQLRKAVEQAMNFIVTINAEGFFKAGGEAVDRAQIQKAIDAAVANVTKMLEGKVDARNREIEKLRKDAAKILTALKAASSEDVSVEVAVKHNEPFTLTPRPASRPSAAKVSAIVDGEPLPPAAFRMLECVARKDGLGRRQLATLSGYTVSGGGFRNTLSALTIRGLVEKRGDAVFVSDRGRELCPTPPAHTPEDVRQMWRGKLPPAAWRMLEVAMEKHPGSISRAELATACGYELSGGGFRNTLSALASNDLVEKSGDQITAAAELIG